MLSWVYSKSQKRNAERKSAGITECPVCHKDFLIKDGYAGCCSKECSDTRKKSEPHADRKCRMCVTTFSCAVSQMTIPLCSDICRTKYHKIIRRNKTDLSAHKAVQKEKKTKEKKIKYIKENGLCSICKTSYRDCERMQSNYTASPEGSVFDGNLVIKCPKYKN